MPKITFLLFFLLATTAPTFAQDFSLSKGAPASKNYYEEIPYETVNGAMYITGEIAGKKHRFLFDTGAPVTLNEDVAAALGLKPLIKVAIADVFSKEDSVQLVELNGIKLGNITFDYIPAAKMTPELFKCLNMAGTIGSNLLRHSIVRIDSKRNLIIITDQKEKLGLDAKKASPMVITEGQSLPKIEFVFAAGGSVVVDFDTGADEFMRINEWLADKLKPYGLIDSLATGYGSGGLGAFGAQKASFKTLHALAPFKVGDAKFSNFKIVSNKEGGLAIGRKLLDYGVITLDFLDSAFYFEAFKKDNDLSRKQWNAMYGFIDGKVVVAEVWDKNLGVEQGTEVLAIDDLDSSKATLCDYLNWPDLIAGKEAMLLTVKTKQGAVKKVKIEKR
jgi:hypothetical protein